MLHTAWNYSLVKKYSILKLLIYWTNSTTF